MKTLLTACSLVLVSPAAARTVAAPNAAELAAARPVIEQLWPLGTYRRLMNGAMSKMMDSMVDQMLASRASDLIPDGMAASEAARKEVGNKSLAELAAAADPHFRERMRITNEVMWREMMPMFDRIEPAVRDSLTSIYARKFTPAQLQDLRAFLATPTGQIYAREWMISFMDEEVMKNIQGFAPELIKSMPAIMMKVQDATKHLPPPPAQKKK